MSSLGSARDLSAPHSDGPGWALRVARALAHDPSDPTTLDEWATRLHLSVKTLQRDFLREFGQPFTTWRTDLRLRASLVLLDTHPVTEVAHRVGYSTPSAYITAFTRHYGHTPGRHTLRRTG
jgi:AraC-like DNA-binding protein